MKIQLPALADCKADTIALLARRGVDWNTAPDAVKLGALVASLRHGAIVEGKPYHDFYDAPEYLRVFTAIMLRIRSTYPSLAGIVNAQARTKIATCGN